MRRAPESEPGCGRGYSCRTASIGSIEAADDLIVLADELERSADHRRVGRVVSLPELLPEHHHPDRILTRRGVGGNEPSTHEGRNVPMIRCVRRNVGPDDILGNVAVRGGQVPAVLPDDALTVRACRSRSN